MRSLPRFIFSARGYPIVPALFVKKTAFFPLNYFYTIVKSKFSIFVWVYWWTLFWSTVLFVLLSMPCCLNYCSFIVVLESESVNCSFSVLCWSGSRPFDLFIWLIKSLFGFFYTSLGKLEQTLFGQPNKSWAGWGCSEF